MVELDGLGIVIEPASGPYPFGRLINSNPLGSGTGSPAVAEWANDPIQMVYAALAHFGISASDVAEQVGDSDLVRLFQAVYPVGALIGFATDTDPATLDIRALICDGSTVSEATYADLFAVIGTKWNTGGEPGGSFRLPDFRGKFRRGYDAGAGIDTGRVFGVGQLDAVQLHQHGLVLDSSLESGGSAAALWNARDFAVVVAAKNITSTYETDGGGTPRTADETRGINETEYVFIRY